MIKVVLTDDHTILRDGITAMLYGDKSISITGEAASGDELLELLQTVPADVVLLDLLMPEKSGLQYIPLLKDLYPDIKVLVLSVLQDEVSVQRAMELGAQGYIHKNAGREELQTAIKQVAANATYVSPSTYTDKAKARDLSRYVIAPVSNGMEFLRLSEAETEILQLVAEGFASNEIAEMLNISKRSVIMHRQNLLSKMNSKNTASMIKYAAKNGIV
ncbi:LuxR family two component transcriptional regulator [Pontibacter ummariensis]|uniref:Two component transcriptional regulator, LuxR family n=1 Tax=Pontibacter ummariensis TaxID=1610492 RepID=A0A239M031_9BACT|nr:response regulator transcription factor [Pontibacter ummariensis]PRX99272.1 LuxR family two component transcriptional regulator [Pontibacter ummariensis]SNT36041.1 two component transcriptional regulator, LuxR family [Pontibacter ummariensis]